MATCKIYVRTQRSDDEVEALATLQDEALSNSAGLKRQAARTAMEWRIGLEPLSIHDRVAWKYWLPTIYRDTYKRKFNHPVRTVSSWYIGLGYYDFDRIPLPVQDIIIRCRDEWNFDWVEIRTPEGTQRRLADSGLFAKKGLDVYLLARWTQSDEPLPTLNQIKAGWTAINQLENLKHKLFLFYIGGPAAVTISLPFFHSYHPDVVELSDGVWVLTVIALSLAAAPWYFWRRMKQRIRTTFAYMF